MDSRIRTLVENCVKTGQRSMFVIVGDKGRDQVGLGLGCCGLGLLSGLVLRAALHAGVSSSWARHWAPQARCCSPCKPTLCWIRRRW